MRVHLAKASRPGDFYVFVQEAYRDERGVARHRTVERLGLLSKLVAEDPDALARLRARVKARDQAREPARGWVAYDTAIPNDGSPASNIGWWLVDAVWSQLDLSQFFDQERRRLGWSLDVGEIVRLLVAQRIVGPGSKRAAVTSQDKLLSAPDVDLGQAYRALDHVGQSAQACQAWARQRVGVGRDAWQIVFFDVTNYYFRPVFGDPTERACLEHPGRATRQVGCSKEHRPTVIVQMGLLLDADLLPVAYRLFDGNIPDTSLMRPVIKELKRTYAIDRLVVVADKAMNTSGNIAHLDAARDGWVFSATARHADQATRRWVLDPHDWTHTSDGARHKSRLVTRQITTRHDDGTTTVSTVTEKQVLTWTPARAAHDQATRQHMIDKAKAIIDQPGKYKPAKKGARKYIHTETVDADGVINPAHDPSLLLSLDQAKIDHDAQYDGYWMATTSETDTDDQAILDAYQHLWRIEDSFRVTKTILHTRPVYVWTPLHIEAHFLTCFLALLITRLIEHTIHPALPAHHIIDAIRGLTARHAGQGVYLIDRPPTWDTIDQTTHHPLNQTWATITQLRAWRHNLTTTPLLATPPNP